MSNMNQSSASEDKVSAIQNVNSTQWPVNTPVSTQDTLITPTRDSAPILDQHEGNADFSTSLDTVDTPPPKKTKKKRTIQENTELQGAILGLLTNGNPPEAIALICNVQLQTVLKVVSLLLATGRLPQKTPEYSILRGGSHIKDIAALNVTTPEYVQVIPVGDGSVIVKPFIINEVNYE